MADTLVITDAVLNAIRDHISTTYTYITVGTGTTTPSTSDTDLETPVTITTTTRNKSYQTLDKTLGTGKLRFDHWLATTEPQTQPVTINEIGLISSSDGSGTLLYRVVLGSGLTKDNTQEWIIKSYITVGRA